MEQIKIFGGETGTKQEKTVNDWLKENNEKIEIIKREVLGSNAMISVVIFYRTID